MNGDMKNREQVQRAYGLFWAIYTGGVPNPWGEDAVTDAVVMSITNVLAWVLEVGNHAEFDVRVDFAKSFLHERGYHAVRVQ
jgi:hypothetical protein